MPLQNNDIVFSYRLGTLADKEALKQLSYIAYEQYSKVLTEENWATFKNNLLNDELLGQLMSISRTFVCTEDNEVVGVAYLVPSGDPTNIFESGWSYIRKVAVHPNYRGCGISKTLTSMCISHATEAKEKILALHTSEFMDAARHIYESMGFKQQKEVAPIFGKRYWLYLMEL